MADPKITGRATLSLRDIYAASFWSWSARTRWVYGIGFVVVVAYTLWIDDVDDIDSLTASGAVPLAIVILGVAAWLVVIAVFFARMSLEQKQIDYEIDRERIVVHDAAGATVIRPWTQVKACHEHRTGFALRMRPMGSHWLVKRAFAPTELQALRALTKSTIGSGGKS